MPGPHKKIDCWAVWFDGHVLFNTIHMRRSEVIRIHGEGPDKAIIQIKISFEEPGDIVSLRTKEGILRPYEVDR